MATIGDDFANCAPAHSPERSSAVCDDLVDFAPAPGMSSAMSQQRRRFKLSDQLEERLAEAKRLREEAKIPPGAVRDELLRRPSKRRVMCEQCDKLQKQIDQYNRFLAQPYDGLILERLKAALTECRQVWGSNREPGFDDLLGPMFPTEAFFPFGLPKSVIVSVSPAIHASVSLCGSARRREASP